MFQFYISPVSCPQEARQKLNIASVFSFCKSNLKLFSNFFCSLSIVYISLAAPHQAQQGYNIASFEIYASVFSTFFAFFSYFSCFLAVFTSKRHIAYTYHVLKFIMPDIYYILSEHYIHYERIIYHGQKTP